ncbi:hypothetical protein TEA_020054 [Camellia sinensis var. sinensis]|uniref:Defective in cullin neddylation protein n=1 Tax=Camellia sinensis var. sinensis TaxID=542762 RepID=A0A4S4DX67_CAMSN|nr:hypothetical protein TEA_020054 [Camellia sinensis var. sinensis]
MISQIYPQTVTYTLECNINAARLSVWPENSSDSNDWKREGNLLSNIIEPSHSDLMKSMKLCMTCKSRSASPIQLGQEPWLVYLGSSRFTTGLSSIECKGNTSALGSFFQQSLRQVIASGKAATKELERIDNLFYAYANNSSVMIDMGTSKNMPYLYWILTGLWYVIWYVVWYFCIRTRPEGIEALCSDLEVDHTDVRILMLAWKMQAEKQGYFTLEEWRRALKALRVDTVTKLKKALPELEKEVKRPSNFVDFYSYAFRYCLTEEKQKSIDIESICQLLDLVLGSQFRAQVDYFVEYLRTQIDYKVINMDQWMGFYRFCNEQSKLVEHANFHNLRRTFVWYP